MLYTAAVRLRCRRYRSTLGHFVITGIFPPMPFRFRIVLGAELKSSDWNLSKRGEESRRINTASVGPSGLEKMMANWIYKDYWVCA